MNFKLIFVIFFLNLLIKSTEAQQQNRGKKSFARIDRVYCNASFVLLANYTCKVYLQSVTYSSINVKLIAKKPIQRAFLYVKAEYRSTINERYKQIVSISKIDVYTVMKGTDNLTPYLRDLVKHAFELLKIPMIEWPVKYLEFINGSLSFPSYATNEMIQSWNKLKNFPNGEYKVTLRAFNYRDDNIVTGTLIITRKIYELGTMITDDSW